MISAPEEYGLNAEQTLAHASAGEPSAEFDAYWRGFQDEVNTLAPHFLISPSRETEHIVFRSIRDVRIAGRMCRPSSSPVGAVITSHGYDGVPADFVNDDEPWAAHNLLTLRIRVRGYPPSVLDCPDLRDEWIVHNLPSAENWILRGAVADLVQAYRCGRNAFGDEFPISFHGESFGAGLAVIAAAQLTALGDPPFRLALGLPTFGDWRWRLNRYCNGLGGRVNMLYESLRDDVDELIHTLLLFDATLHARALPMPVLCKLATLDDTVPAPTAAAVFNAMPEENKKRFVVRYGHFDGGVADLRRHAYFERLHPSFLDPTQNGPEWIENADQSFAFEL